MNGITCIILLLHKNRYILHEFFFFKTYQSELLNIIVGFSLMTSAAVYKKVLHSSRIPITCSENSTSKKLLRKYSDYK